MALRSTARLLKTDGVLHGEGGLRGLMQRVTERLSSGKLIRPDVADDMLRVPVEKSQYRDTTVYEESEVIIPQGPYKNVFDITYHARDSRRKNAREELASADFKPADDGLPPTAGVPPQHTFLGMAGDFDRAE